MSIAVTRKKDVIKTYQTDANDTGSAEVQIALKSDQINALSEHLKTHKKDISSRRGLLLMVAHRRKMLDYLRSVNEDRYLAIIGKLGLRR
jgi:small subunit ribosomal protein S15